MRTRSPQGVVRRRKAPVSRTRLPRTAKARAARGSSCGQESGPRRPGFAIPGAHVRAPPRSRYGCAGCGRPDCTACVAVHERERRLPETWGIRARASASSMTQRADIADEGAGHSRGGAFCPVSDADQVGAELGELGYVRSGAGPSPTEVSRTTAAMPTAMPRAVKKLRSRWYRDGVDGQGERRL